ncbi:MAG: hypothetical protein J6T57_02775 [Alphaproteobacteria bacterium]|nr:hypothetical protein [Alphaproteobacteria bacterium]
MKKVIFVICMLCGGAFAANEGLITSRAYVDAGLAATQSTITNGTGVMTHDSTQTDGVGQKPIYNPLGDYATQSNALVTASTANAAVQNAIAAEFECIEWDPNDNTKCWLVKINAEQLSLPADYTKLEYLQSTGTQYIDTGYIPNQSTGVQTKVKFNSVTNGQTMVFGAGTSYNARSFEFYTWNQQTEFNYNSARFGVNVSLNDIVELNWNKNIVNYSINGVQQNTMTLPASTFTVLYTMTLFTLSRPGGYFIGNIYYFKIYDNDVLVRDFIPAQRNSDGELGMYDTISRTFFTNAGTGSFIAGPVKNVYMPTGNQ